MFLGTVFIITTVFLGNLILMAMRPKPIGLLTHIVLGWLVGFSITSFFLYILTFIVPINMFVMLIVIAAQWLLMFILSLKRKLPKAFAFQFNLPRLEQSLPFFFCVFVAAFYGFAHLYDMFICFPEKTPFLSAPIIDEEIAVTNSILYGRNRRHLLWLDDPLAYGKKYHNSYMPHFYTAALIALNADYRSATFTLAFINVITASVLLFNYLTTNTKNTILAFFIFMFNGGIAAYRPLFSKYSVEDDLLTNVGDKCQIPWYQTIAFLLCASKDASFSICMSLAVLFMIRAKKVKNVKRQFLIAAFFAVFIPNPGACFAMFLMLSSYGDSFMTIMPFSLVLLFKMHGQKIQHFPLWREQQMSGHLVSEVTMLFKGMWLMPIGFVFSLLLNTSIDWAHRDLTALSVFVLMLFIRVGNSTYNNIVAITCTVLPIMSANFADTFYFIKNYDNFEVQRTIRTAILSITYGMFLLGGVVSGYRMIYAQVDCFTANSIQASKWISEIVGPNEVVLSRAHAFNPASLCGRQVISGDFRNTWLRGANITNSVALIRQSELSSWKDVANILSAKVLLVPNGSTDNIDGFLPYKSNSAWLLYVNK